MRLYRDLGEVIDRDAIVIGDGGDFVSYAGRVVDTYQPGCWLDPGPVRLPGQRARLRAGGQGRPPRSPGRPAASATAPSASAAWSSTPSRGTASTWSAVMGNNGIWALEKHPMEFLYGYSVAAELRPGTRYDQVVAALGGHGELVERPADLKPALERAFSAGLPPSSTSSPIPTSSIPAGRTWRRADLADAALAARVLAVQHAAYAIEAELIGYPDLPPLHETLEGLQATRRGAVAVRGGRRAGRASSASSTARTRWSSRGSSWRPPASGAVSARRSSRTRWRRRAGDRVRVGTGARNAAGAGPLRALRLPPARRGLADAESRLRRARTRALKRWKPPGGRLPKLAPTGRAGVRAMKGPVRRSERREAPIRCGFARTYEAGSRRAHAMTARTPLRQRCDCPPSDHRGAIKHTSSWANRSGDVRKAARRRQARSASAVACSDRGLVRRRSGS